MPGAPRGPRPSRPQAALRRPGRLRDTFCLRAGRGFPPFGQDRVVGELVPVQVELASDEIHDGRRHELARSQQPARVAEHAQLQREAQLVAGAPLLADGPPGGGGTVARSGARRDSRAAVAGARHQHHHRPAHLAPHRPHAVGLFGDDLAVLRSRGDQTVAAMEDIPGVVDLALEPQSDIPTVRVGFDRAALARRGLPAGEAALTLETALHGREVGQIFDDQIAVPLVVRRESSLTTRRSPGCRAFVSSSSRRRRNRKLVEARLDDMLKAQRQDPSTGSFTATASSHSPAGGESSDAWKLAGPVGGVEGLDADLGAGQLVIDWIHATDGRPPPSGTLRPMAPSGRRRPLETR